MTSYYAMSYYVVQKMFDAVAVYRRWTRAAWPMDSFPALRWEVAEYTQYCVERAAPYGGSEPIRADRDVTLYGCVLTNPETGLAWKWGDFQQASDE